MTEYSAVTKYQVGTIADPLLTGSTAKHSLMRAVSQQKEEGFSLVLETSLHFHASSLSMTIHSHILEDKKKKNLPTNNVK